MVFQWKIALDVMVAAASAYMDHVKQRNDEQARERDRALILGAIREAQQAVLSELVRQKLTQLDGELEGFRTIYASYDPDPNDIVEHERLRSLIDDATATLGELGKLIDQVHAGGPAADLALQSWPIYLQLLYLRAQAMTERHVTYGATEIADAIPSLDQAVDRAELLLAYLRILSDARFTPVTCRVQTNRIACWYKFEKRTFVVGPRDGTLARKRHMDMAYPTFDGVAEITESAADLRQATMLLAALSVVERFTVNAHGPTFPPVVVNIDGRVEVDDDNQHGPFDLDRIFAHAPRVENTE